MTSLSPSKQTQAIQRAGVEVIRCGVGDETYCLEMSAVASVMPAGDLHLNETNDAQGPVGFMEHGRREIPVFDLSAALNLPWVPTPEGHYIILIHHPIENYGLRVESVSRVIRLPEENVLPLPKSLEHTGRWFRGIADFTRDRQVDRETFTSRHLPGISEPREMPSNRRRRQHQMQLLLNPRTLLADRQTQPDPPPPLANLLRRYASVDALCQPGGVRQLVVFPAGVKTGQQILLGLSISQVAEIIEPLPLISVPGANANISGFAQWRNCPVPILDLQASLHCQEETGPANHWLVARDHQSNGLIVLPVADRIQSLRLPIDHRPCPLPDKTWDSFVLGSFEFEERILIIPRLGALSGLSS